MGWGTPELAVWNRRCRKGREVMGTCGNVIPEVVHPEPSCFVPGAARVLLSILKVWRSKPKHCLWELYKLLKPTLTLMEGRLNMNPAAKKCGV